ncbi:MAG: tyrosine-type recombinase/integrase, partial [Gammaproteobacteria bacterium]
MISCKPILDEGTRCSAAYVKTMAMALRSYLRFLAMRGECRPGLDHAVPPTPDWRLSSLPRYLLPEDIRVMGKGRRERVLPLWKETATAIRAWISIRPKTSAPELFLNGVGAPMTRSGFAYILRKHVERAAATQPSLRDRPITPHVLRHTCAMHILAATHDIR